MLSLPKFDPSKEFICTVNFRAGGIVWSKGFLFDKSAVPERTVRLLYEQHKLVYDDSEKGQRLFKTLNARVSGKPRLESKPSDEEVERLAVEKLVKENSKAALLQMAAGLAGISRTDNKTQIATAIHRSGIAV